MERVCVHTIAVPCLFVYLKSKLQSARFMFYQGENFENVEKCNKYFINSKKRVMF